MYCRPVEALEPFRKRILHTAEGFWQAFRKNESSCVTVYSAPGRTEIGGNHTDHQRGRVLTGSVDLDAIAVATLNGSTTVNLRSEGYETVSVNCGSLLPVKGEENTTAALVRGILARITERGYSVSGFDAYVISDVPGGSGLSSSACFEVLTASVVNGLFCCGAFPLPELARIGPRGPDRRLCRRSRQDVRGGTGAGQGGPQRGGRRRLLL